MAKKKKIKHISPRRGAYRGKLQQHDHHDHGMPAGIRVCWESSGSAGFKGSKKIDAFRGADGFRKSR